MIEEKFLSNRILRWQKLLISDRKGLKNEKLS